MNLSIPKNKTTDTIILIAAFWSAIIVGVTTFLYNSWQENDMGNKIRIFIHEVFSFIERVAHFITTETDENVNTDK